MIHDTQQGKCITQTVKYTMEILKTHNTRPYISQQRSE